MIQILQFELGYKLLIQVGHKGPGKYSEGLFINEWFSGGQKIYLKDGTPLSKW